MISIETWYIGEICRIVYRKKITHFHPLDPTLGIEYIGNIWLYFNTIDRQHFCRRFPALV